jgi:hypothetical protein
MLLYRLKQLRSYIPHHIYYTQTDILAAPSSNLAAEYPPIELFTSLNQRISHLESQIFHLNISQRRLASIEMLLRLSETFRQLHRALADFGDKDLLKSKRVQRLVSKYQLSVEDLQKTIETCRERNEAAHPTELPDLTDAPIETMRVYVKVRHLLNDLTKHQ